MSHFSRIRAGLGLGAAAAVIPMVIAAPAASAAIPEGQAEVQPPTPVESEIETIGTNEEDVVSAEFALDSAEFVCWSEESDSGVLDCQGEFVGILTEHDLAANGVRIDLNAETTEYIQGNQDINLIEPVGALEENKKYDLDGTIVQVVGDTFYFSNPSYETQGELTVNGVEFTS